MVNASRSSRCLPSPANGSSSAPSNCALPSALISRLRLSGLVGQTRKRCEKHPHFGCAHDLGPFLLDTLNCCPRHLVNRPAPLAQPNKRSTPITWARYPLHVPLLLQLVDPVDDRGLRDPHTVG